MLEMGAETGEEMARDCKRWEENMEEGYIDLLQYQPN